MRNSRGEWQILPRLQDVPLGLVFVDAEVAARWPARDGEAVAEPRDAKSSEAEHDAAGAVVGADPGVGKAESGPFRGLVPALTVQGALDKVGYGWLVGLQDTERGRCYGRGVKLADVLTGERVVLVKWVRRMTGWQGRVATLEQWEKEIRPAVVAGLEAEGTPVVSVKRQQHQWVAQVSLAHRTVKAPVDGHGVAILNPVVREVTHPECASCSRLSACRQLSPAAGTASLWRRLRLVDERGVPTRRGRVVAALSQTAGLAIAAALEDEGYPLDELVYDLANLDAGFRFAGEDSRWGGRLAVACQAAYGMINVPGYLESGLPPRYGAGANDLVQLAHRQPEKRHRATTESLGEGDVDRLIIEWRSLLRQIGHASSIEWPRWTAFQAMARGIVQETESPTQTDLPALPYGQTKRVDHRLSFRRH